MKCPKCNKSEFNYIKRLFMVLFGAIYCKNCTTLISIKQKPGIFSIAIGLLILLSSAFLIDRLSFIFVLIIGALGIALFNAWRSPLKEVNSKNKFLRISLLTFRYIILIPVLIIVLIGIPTILFFYHNSPPIVKKDIDLGILEFVKIDKDTSVDAMPIILSLPKFTTSDSALISSSYNNDYSVNSKLEKIIDESYLKISPLIKCTHIDTGKLTVDTSFLFKGEKRYDELRILTPYLKLLLININNSIENNNFDRVIENLSIGLHINNLIAESEISLISTMVSIFYTQKIFEILITKQEKFNRISNVNSINTILDNFTFNYEIFLNSLRNEYEIQKRGLSYTLNEVECAAIGNIRYRKKISKSYYDFEECVDIQNHVWARILLEVNMPIYQKDSIEHYEINQLIKYYDDPNFYRLILHPNTYGRILASVASPDYSAGRYKVINMKRKKAFLQNVLIIKSYKLRFNKFPNSEEFAKLKPPIDPATNLPFLYDPIKKEISAEFDSRLSDSIFVKL